MLEVEAEPQAERKVVVIDDHPLVREGLVSLLKAKGYHVVADAADAAQGVSLVKEHIPDVLVTDISMPTNPFGMVKDSIKFLPSLKVVVLTAFGTEFNLEQALSCGVSGFVTKSASTDELADALSEVLSGRQYFSKDIQQRLRELREKSAQGNIRARHRSLSRRELEVLKLVANGLPAKAIAKELHISVKTVDRHKSNIMAKLEMHNQVDLTRYAIREGIIKP